MIKLKNPDFIACSVQQYVHGTVLTKKEIISPEEACHFSYSCLDVRKSPEEKSTGSKMLYAYPMHLKSLVLGHTVLDMVAPSFADAYIVHDVYEKRSGHWHVDLQLHAQPMRKVMMQKMTYATVLEVMDNMLAAHGLWEGTGCFHRAALYHPQRQEMLLVEDIGRHNCVDRLYGQALLQGLEVQEFFLFITSRITGSLYKKIRRAGISHMVSRAAITSTTYTCAVQEGCTVVGFCRPKEKRMTIFCGNGIEAGC